MTTTFLSEGVWAELTEAVSNSKRQCFAAVAYFAKGASSQLPLPKESLLVVNASDSMVAAGVTCPDELIKLHHCCPATSRTDSIGCRYRLSRYRSPSLEVPVKWAFSRTELG